MRGDPVSPLIPIVPPLQNAVRIQNQRFNQMALAGSFPRPAFGSSPNLQALAKETEKARKHRED